jgi:hypothetical protein
VDRLAADDHEFVESNSVGGGADDMVEIFAAQLRDLREDLAPLGFRECAGERRRLPQIAHAFGIGAQRSPYVWDWPIQNVKPGARVAIVDPAFALPLPNLATRGIDHRPS